MRLSELWIYPVKSCRGIRLEESQITQTGLAFDRHWMIVDASGRFVTQREHAKLAGIHVRMVVRKSGDGLELSAADHDSVSVPAHTQTRREIRVWEFRGPAEDAGDEAAEWLSSYLGTQVRLVRMAEDAHRAAGSAFEGEARTSFTDGYPFLLIGSASLADLNSRLAVPVGMDRFRPNLVIETEVPYVEDTWTKLRLGDTEFAVVKPCARCVMTLIDPSTIEKGKEPLRTLNQYRRQGDEVLFGQNLVHLAQGGLARGDALTLTRAPRNHTPS